MLFIAVDKELHIALALMALTAGSASVAIADVTIDACVAQKSGSHHSLASDLQSLCSLSASIGSLIGFSSSGIFVHLIGPQVSFYLIIFKENCMIDLGKFQSGTDFIVFSKGVFGILMIPAGLVFLVGILLKESRGSTFAYEQVLVLIQLLVFTRMEF